LSVKVEQIFSPKLTDLDLSHNRIAAIHKAAFEHVKPTVQTINLGHNRLQELPASGASDF
jgi:Leucine-rich repeat (LRR) protein